MIGFKKSQLEKINKVLQFISIGTENCLFSENIFFDQDRKKLIAYAIARADDSTYVIPSLSRQFE